MVALVKFVNHDGVVREVEAASGSSLMQVAALIQPILRGSLELFLTVSSQEV